MPTRPPLPPAVPWLAGAAGLVFVTSAALAVIQPGDLGDDDVAAVGPTSTTVLTPTTAPPTTATTLGTSDVVDPATGGASPQADEVDGAGGDPGAVDDVDSGLTATGAPDDTTGELSNSGHESLLLPGGLLTVAAVGGVRARRSSSA